MRQRGIPLYPPDVNASKARFLVEDGAGGRRRALRAGGDQGRGRRPRWTALVEEREARGPFRDVYDLMARLGTKVLNKRLLESLIRAGAFDALEPATGAGCSTAADLLLRYAAASAEAAESAQVSLFGGSGAGAGAAADLCRTSRTGRRWSGCRWSSTCSGLYLSAHPLDGYRTRWSGWASPPAIGCGRSRARAAGCGWPG